MKQKLVNEIVKEYCLTPDILAHDYYYEWVKLKMKLTSSEDQALTTDVPTSYHGISEERSELHTSKPLQDLSLSASAVTSEPKVLPTISKSQGEKEDISCGDLSLSAFVILFCRLGNLNIFLSLCLCEIVVLRILLLSFFWFIVKLTRVPLQAILLANSFATTFRPITLERPKGYMGLGRFIYFYW
ncbi:uncharacterized protein LOC133033623 isoform X2 [Cannabis sativa]|uniref:uncharacterized protein LOC133033623 isoform X2 n=1 Tax=Cannabis sativa TaxID=3483 RepID=UPI0029C9DEEF|nr:uncharacterized protein LOC133033623 isoform X2 [Cannabis sativa]